MMEQSEPVSSVEQAPSTSSKFSSNPIAGSVPSVGGRQPLRAKRWKLTGSLNADQVAQIILATGLLLDRFQEVRASSEKASSLPATNNLAFSRFWDIYPRHDVPGAAARAWKELGADEALLAVIEADIRRKAASYDWMKDGGKWIPYAHSYLNGKRWLDEGIVKQAIPQDRRRTIV